MLFQIKDTPFSKAGKYKFVYTTSKMEQTVMREMMTEVYELLMEEEL